MGMRRLQPIEAEEIEEQERLWYRRVPPYAGLLLVVFIFAIDFVLQRGSPPYLEQGVLDEPAHAATVMLLILAWPWALGQRFVLWMLAASVLLDVDHVPIVIHFQPLIAHGGPYTHSLATVLMALVVTYLWSRWGAIGVLGIPCGLAAHLFRDTFTGDLPLWWPLSSVQFQLIYVPYALALVAMAAWVWIRVSAGRGAPE